MQVRRELRLNSVSGLNRNDYVAGQVCNSRHYSQQLLLASLHREDSGQGGGGGCIGRDKGLRENARQMTYRPLQACESSMMRSPCCQCGDCPSATSERREIDVEESSGQRKRKAMFFSPL